MSKSQNSNLSKMTDINKSVSGLNFSSPYDVETPFGTPNPPNHGMLIWSLGVTVYCAHWNPLMVKVLINVWYFKHQLFFAQKHSIGLNESIGHYSNGDVFTIFQDKFINPVPNILLS